MGRFPSSTAISAMCCHSHYASDNHPGMSSPAPEAEPGSDNGLLGALISAWPEKWRSSARWRSRTKQARADAPARHARPPSALSDQRRRASCRRRPGAELTKCQGVAASSAAEPSGPWPSGSALSRRKRRASWTTKRTCRPATGPLVDLPAPSPRSSSCPSQATPRQIPNRQQRQSGLRAARERGTADGPGARPPLMGGERTPRSRNASWPGD